MIRISIGVFDDLEKGHTINSDRCPVLQLEIVKKRMKKKIMFFHQGNAPCHSISENDGKNT